MPVSRIIRSRPEEDQLEVETGRTMLLVKDQHVVGGSHLSGMRDDHAARLRKAGAAEVLTGSVAVGYPLLAFGMRMVRPTSLGAKMASPSSP
ncbi:hypothetical protein DPM13_09215 [Paracoccus mutanolyticus]|uniref:Uncharacterized protein n=1 Tax=Paracoccus mutanolyticus TaxID=1499308 RepID=A0ABM6WRG1_9RHOB|nr:hypothetical protein DPM13_09215 [Paracoccus mutanolyticus]